MSASEMAMGIASIKKHENIELQNAVILLKKKVIKGKRLNVLGREDGSTQLFGFDEI